MRESAVMEVGRTSERGNESEQRCEFGTLRKVVGNMKRAVQGECGNGGEEIAVECGEVCVNACGGLRSMNTCERKRD